MAVYQSSIAGIVAASRGMCSTILAIDKVAIYRTVTQTVQDLTAEYQELGTRIKIAPDSDKAFMTTSEFYDQNIVDFEGLVNRLEEEGMPEQNEDTRGSLEKGNQGLAYRFMHHGLTFTPGGKVADTHNAANDTVITMLNMLAMIGVQSIIEHDAFIGEEATQVGDLEHRRELLLRPRESLQRPT
ncbi:hypothetical protein H2202_002150 [Exophiala xenobiotica]|nr:hypothetical protein H2202_002150 [Exophiala xenobiotica]